MFRHERAWENCFRVNGTSVYTIAQTDAILTSRFAADYFGHINTIIFYSIITGISSITLWVYASGFEMLMAYAIIFGFFGGAFITLSK